MAMLGMRCSEPRTNATPAVFLQVRPLKPNVDPLNGTQIYVIVVSVITVLLWCFNTFLSTFTGEMGILAIIPLVAFFGFGVLE